MSSKKQKRAKRQEQLKMNRLHSDKSIDFQTHLTKIFNYDKFMDYNTEHDFYRLEIALLINKCIIQSN